MTGFGVWLVFKEAIYRHECIGAFSSEDGARKAAEHAASIEGDNHHSLAVYGPYVLDEAIQIAGKPDHAGNPGYVEPPRVHESKNPRRRR